MLHTGPRAAVPTPIPPPGDAHQPDEIVGESDALRYVMFRVDQVASTDATVLLHGETGTGKELLARAIHRRSARRARPFVVVDCAGMPASLIESELFGRERGAFTGAHATQVGRFELAMHGTIFLDEIGELPLEVQPKLLRVLQEGQVERLGNPRPVDVDVRVIAATNRDLPAMVIDGRFQEDLYYRLNVIPIHIPPLRERREDIPVLVEHFIKKHAQRAGKTIDGIETGVLEALQSSEWPGNVRELENTLERAVVLSLKPTIGPDAVRLLGVPTTPPAGLPSLNLRHNLDWAERETVRRALDNAGGVKKDAAEAMGISQRALSYYLAKHRIE